MADSTPLASESLADLVFEDEDALNGCADWLRSLEIAVGWLIESVQKCMRAEALKAHKQGAAIAQLRDAARKLSDVLVEGDGHVGIVYAPIAYSVRQEMHALQDPLIGIFAGSPTGFASWPTIRDQYLDALLAALEGLKAESRHVVRLVAVALESHRRKQLPNTESAVDDGLNDRLLSGPNDVGLLPDTKEQTDELQTAAVRDLRDAREERESGLRSPDRAEKLDADEELQAIPTDDSGPKLTGLLAAPPGVEEGESAADSRSGLLDGAAHRGSPRPIARTESGSVLLFGRKDFPLVKCIEKPTLTAAQYDVVLALLRSGDKGLTKDKLDRESGRGDARKILKRLSDSDSDWESAISFPGTTGKGYRII